MKDRLLGFVGAKLIDGTENTPIDEAVLIVEGDKIQQVGTRSTVSLPDDIITIDSSKYTLMPGLIDAHVHFNGGRSHRFAERIIPSKGLRLIRAAQDAKDALNKGGLRSVGCACCSRCTALRTEPVPMSDVVSRRCRFRGVASECASLQCTAWEPLMLLDTVVDMFVGKHSISGVLQPCGE